MMGRTVVFGFILSLGIAVGLFQLKYSVAEQERRMTEISSEIYQIEEAMHILQAEWSYLNEPGRLQTLAQQHLSLAPSETIQLVGYDAIDKIYERHQGHMKENVLRVKY